MFRRETLLCRKHSSTKRGPTPAALATCATGWVQACLPISSRKRTVVFLLQPHALSCSRPGFATAQAAKAAFQHDQFDLMPSQGTISFLSGSSIMDFYAPFLTMRAGCLCRCCHHLNSDRSICEPFLAHNMQLVQV
jgi:hypothetical protein